MNTSIKSSFFAAGVLLCLCGCSGNLDGNAVESDRLTLGVSVNSSANGKVTRTELINWASTSDAGYVSGEHAMSASSKFGLYGFDGSTMISGLSPASATWNNGDWQAPEYQWPRGKELLFVGYFPEILPINGQFNVGRNSISFNYDASKQKDIMFSFYSGKGVNGKATLNFSHALTSVMFKIGSVPDNLGKITSIKLDGVYSSGTCTGNPDAENYTYSYVWTNTTLTETVEGTGEFAVVSGAVLPDAFVFTLIPQDLSVKPVKFTVKTADGRTLEATVNTDKWEAGHTNLYTINLTDLTFDPVVVTAWGAGISQSINLF